METAKAMKPQEITTAADTRDILAHARRQADARNLDEYFIVDVDSHHVETDSWQEVLTYIDDEVMRYTAESMIDWDPGVKALLAHAPGIRFQDVSGRIPHQQRLAEGVPTTSTRDVTLSRRAMDSMSIDAQVVFPQPMLGLGTHPLKEMEVALAFAYNRWFADNILAQDERIKGLLYLPFRDPNACVRMVEEFADHESVLGFMVTSIRHQAVHDNSFMPLYELLEERGIPLAFHAGPSWGDQWTKTTNRFLSMHAISFTLCNMVHLTNWIINGLPERFPNLKVMWLESGLAWIPFMMQRLDNEYLMRQSDAPLLRRRPSEYMREMYYTTQPMECTHPKLLEATFEAIEGETQVMYSSDWPHWDFDLPSTVYDLPFLSEQGRRNVLGETARKVFNLG